MKAISLFKVFTAVGILSISLLSNKSFSQTSQDRIKYCDGIKASFPGTQQQKNEEYSKCLQNGAPTPVDSTSECRSISNSYTSAVDKANEECSKLGADYANCRNKISTCETNTSSSFSNTSDGWVNMLSMALASRQGSSASGNSTCYDDLLTYNDDFQKEQERLDDKIADLTKDIDKLKEDANEEDRKLNEKRNDVEKEMLESQKVFTTKKYETRTELEKASKEEADKIGASATKKRDLLMLIQEKNIEMANQAFAFQELQLRYVASEVTAKCLKERNDLADKELYKIDKNGKKTEIKFDKKTARLKRNAILAKETSCLANEALKKAAETKSISDAKQKIQRDIDNFNGQIQDETDNMKRSQDALAALKKNKEDEETELLKNLNKELDQLNKSVVDLEAYVNKKKQNLSVSVANIEARIKQIQQDKLRVSGKYSKASRFVTSADDQKNIYTAQCCDTAKPDPRMGCPRASTDKKSSSSTGKTDVGNGQ